MQGSHGRLRGRRQRSWERADLAAEPARDSVDGFPAERDMPDGRIREVVSHRPRTRIQRNASARAAGGARRSLSSSRRHRRVWSRWRPDRRRADRARTSAPRAKRSRGASMLSWRSRRPAYVRSGVRAPRNRLASGEQQGRPRCAPAALLSPRRVPRSWFCNRA